MDKDKEMLNDRILKKVSGEGGIDLCPEQNTTGSDPGEGLVESDSSIDSGHDRRVAPHLDLFGNP